MLCVRAMGVQMSDGDTRKVNEKALKDPGEQWRPMAKFKSFQKNDQIWVLVGIGLLILTMNIVFGLGGDNGATNDMILK
jgi:hypothetical protein